VPHEGLHLHAGGLGRRRRGGAVPPTSGGGELPGLQRPYQPRGDGNNTPRLERAGHQ
ncbi:unnamed protein product, partial [Prorocentrum cordatum]